MDIVNAVKEYQEPEIVDFHTLSVALNNFLLEMKGNGEEPKPYSFYELKLTEIFQKGRIIYLHALDALHNNPNAKEEDSIFDSKVETLGYCMYALRQLIEYQVILKKDKAALQSANPKELKGSAKYWSEVLISLKKNGILGPMLPQSCCYYQYLEVSAKEYIDRAEREVRSARKRVKKSKNTLISRIRTVVPASIFYAIGLFVLMELINMCRPFVAELSPLVLELTDLIPIVIQLFIVLTFPLKAIKNGNRYWVFFLFTFIVFGCYYGENYLGIIPNLHPIVYAIFEVVNNYGPVTSIHYQMGLTTNIGIIATCVSYLLYGFMLLPWAKKEKKIITFPSTNRWN